MAAGGGWGDCHTRDGERKEQDAETEPGSSDRKLVTGQDCTLLLGVHTGMVKVKEDGRPLQ